ncbi:hypothetical protein SeLEV6574_g06664 [Synchytrium endobioticum]|uniref:Uncharacterized protein n=1 Tax=Synchytrium endobioticum TaxID=286115 RepID=A0A507CKT4_9FUNG|nr:hypothetical protein SeLEV6574_g06664 [Synchytrium endobioticum]
MVTTTACSIKATAVMCLLWMVFLSASATGRWRRRNLAAEQKALQEVGTYGNADELEADETKLSDYKVYVQHIMVQFEAIYANLESKLSLGFHPVNGRDLEELRELEILVTTEKFPWLQTPPQDLVLGSFRRKYPKYIELFEKCVSLYKKYMENMAVMTEGAVGRQEYNAGNSEQPNLDEEALQAAFNKVGTFRASKDLSSDFISYVNRMTTKFQAIYANLQPMLSKGIYPLDEKDFMNLRHLRKLVTTERLPWKQFKEPYASSWEKEYNEYSGLLYNCVSLFDTHMVNVVCQLGGMWRDLEEKVRLGEYLENDPHMEIMQRIIQNEQYIWEAVPKDWTHPYSHSRSPNFVPYSYRCRNGYTVLNIYKNKHKDRSNSTPRLPQSTMDSATQGTTNHGKEGSAVSGGVAEPIASNQQWPPATNDGNAGTSHGSTYADRSEFGYVPGFDLGQPDDTATMRHYADPYGYGISTECYHAYIGDDSSIEGTTSFAHPPTYAPAGPSSSYAGVSTPYPPTPHDHTGLFSPYPGVSTPYLPTPHDPAGPSGYGSSDPPSGSKRFKPDQFDN